MSQQLTGSFVLPADVLLIPVAELTPAVRARLDCAEGDVAITRPRSRRPSSVVDAHSARLLELFRAPARVVDAIVQFSRDTASDPRVVLEQAFPLVEKLVTSGLLLASGDARAHPIDDALTHGSRIGDFAILDRIQLLEDVELHRARAGDGTFAAIKIARPAHADALRPALAREAAILERLGGHGAPRLVATATVDARPYIAQGWCFGVSPTRAAAEFRDRGASGRRELVDLCIAIVEAYASLHERGVLHGDVHDRNILIGPAGEVTLLDFGLAAVPGDPSIGRARRGGVPDYYDPQLASAWRADGHAPPLTAASDQYCAATLLYFAVCGEPYLELSMRRDEALRQIAEDAPRAFERAGAPPWADLERVLSRALAKDVAARFASMREFASALRAVESPSAIEAPMVGTRSATRRRFIDQMVARLDPAGPLYARGLPSPPYCSVNNGAAGIAYAFYRMSIVREDPILLANAGAWIARARAWATEPEGWYTLDKLIAEKEFGAIALYHTATGLHCVAALIALAEGDAARAGHAADAFIAASRRPCRNIDLTLGKAGTVVGAALMLEASPIRLAALRKRGDQVASALERRIASFGDIDNEPRLRYLGIAHGWSGLLWTLLRWRRANTLEPTTLIGDRLDELALLGTPRGRGVAWAWSVNARDIGMEANPAPTWCNGAAGQVHLWLEAHDAFGDDRYLDLARTAAWNVWDDSRDGLADACCGLTGRAYSLLALHRRTGDDAWKRRAETMADAAMRASVVDAPSSHRLFKGALGTALLLEELESAPDDARMPVFESEGWRWR